MSGTRDFEEVAGRLTVQTADGWRGSWSAGQDCITAVHHGFSTDKNARRNEQYFWFYLFFLLVRLVHF